MSGDLFRQSRSNFMSLSLSLCTATIGSFRYAQLSHCLVFSLSLIVCCLTVTLFRQLLVLSTPTFPVQKLARGYNKGLPTHHNNKKGTQSDLISRSTISTRIWTLNKRVTSSKHVDNLQTSDKLAQHVQTSTRICTTRLPFDHFI